MKKKNFITIFIAMLLGGFANRIRGGWLGEKINKIIPEWGATKSRIFFGLIVSLIMFFFNDNYYSFLYIPCLWGSYAIAGWFKSGSMEGLKEFIKMTFRGILFSLCLAPMLYFSLITILQLILIAIALPICYFIGNRLPIKIKNFYMGMELAEFIFGMVLILILVL